MAARTTVLVVLVLLAGCLGPTGGGTAGRQAVLEGHAVEAVPPNATVTPYADLPDDHPALRTVVRDAAAADGDLAQVWIDAKNVSRVESDLAGLPHYTAPADSEYDYGYYVRYRNATVVVTMVVED